MALVVRKYIVPPVAIIFVTFGVVLLCVVIHIRHLLAGQDQVERSFNVLVTLEKALSAVKDSEISVRDFALTGDERALTLYKLSAKRAREEFASAQGMTFDDHDQQRRLVALAPIVAQRMDLLERLAALRRKGGLDAAAQEVRSERGEPAMTVLRHGVADLETAEKSLLTQRRLNTQRELSGLIAISAAGVTVCSGLACFALGRILQEMNLRKKAERASEQVRIELEERVAARTLDLRNAEEFAREGWKKAEAASEAKTDFLARVSHELRTPLNSILGFGQLLEIGPALPPVHKSSVHYILRAGYHLLELVDELLDINAADSGRITLSLEPVPLRQIIYDCVDMIRPQAQAAAIELIISHEMSDTVHVHADRQRLRQVLLNLLSNAVKFNRPDGKVCVACEQSGEELIRTKIIDTGHGILPGDMAKLCSPFERLGQSNSGTEGEGLGLLLARRLTEAMGGAFGASSIPDQGSTFWIELPRADSPVTNAPDSIPAEPNRPFDARKTVLYVEDNLSNLTLIEHVLKHRPSITLIPAMQGRLALEIARERMPDLILLDLHLPDISGEEVLRKLRFDSQTKAIPVVFLSAEVAPAKRQRLLDAGARAFLSKPLNVAAFLATLENELTVEALLPAEG
jgi:signal transduction histidine kinase/ActR/RegA family two-component response regulator